MYIFCLIILFFVLKKWLTIFWEDQPKEIIIPIQLQANPFLCAIKSVSKLMCRKLTQCVKNRCGAVFVWRLRTYHVLLSGKFNASTKSPDNKIMTEYFCTNVHITIIYRAYTFSHNNTSDPNIQCEHSNSITLEWDKQQGIQWIIILLYVCS